MDELGCIGQVYFPRFELKNESLHPDCEKNALSGHFNEGLWQFDVGKNVVTYVGGERIYRKNRQDKHCQAKTGHARYVALFVLFWQLFYATPR